MVKSSIAIAIFSLISSSVIAQNISDPSNVRRVAKPIIDASGQKQYLISINPFVIREAGLKKSASLEKKAQVADLDNKHQQPAGWSVIAGLVQKYKFRPVEAYTWSSPSVVAWLTENQAIEIAKDPAVTGVTEDQEEEIHLSALGPSAYGDQIAGDEVTSWAKVFTNTNDSITSTTPFYLIDSSLSPYYTAQQDLNIIASDSYYSDYPEHAVHVAGVIGAKINGFGAVGINPNQPIKLFTLLGATNAGVRQASDKVMRDAEASNHFSVVNMSQNSSAGSFQHNADTPGGRKFRAMSNRLLVTQSAGNKLVDACEMAFHYKQSTGTPHARQNDGILVVGGLMRDGTKFIDLNGPAGDPGTNSGNCIEAWAPAHQITSTLVSQTADPTNTTLPAKNTTAVLSGTSFSAPMVAAIASRYGDVSTRPLEREAYVRASLFNTGAYDGANPIRTIRYTPPSNHNIPKRLNISGATSPTGSNNLSVLYDGKFYSDTDFWVAGGYYGSITFDLGSIRTVTGIRVTPRSDVNTNLTEASMNFAVGGANDPVNIAETAYYTEYFQADQAPVYIPFETNSRYIRLNASNNFSWVAYSEVEIYGY